MKRLAAMLLAVCLLLSGCGTWMEGRYVSVTPYLSQDDHDGQDVQWISNEDELYEVVRYMVNQGVTEDVFFVREYLENELRTDIFLVRFGIMSREPMGAFAVEDIRFEIQMPENFHHFLY